MPIIGPNPGLGRSPLEPQLYYAPQLILPGVPFNQEDWPLPQGHQAQRQYVDRTWISNYTPNYQWPTPDTTKILRPHLRSLPNQPYPPNAFQSWAQSLAHRLVRPPPGEQVVDLTPAQRPPEQVQLHSWAYNITVRFPVAADTTKIFRGHLRSLPDQPAQPLLQQSIYRAQPFTLFGVQNPFSQDDWPLSRAPQQPAQSFTASYNLCLIGQDKLTVGEIIFDLTPRDYQRQAPSWTASYNLNLIGKDALPIGEQRYDLTPAQTKLPDQIQLHSWTSFYNPNLIGQDKLPTGEQRYDLAPRDFPRLFQTWIQNVSQALTFQAFIPVRPFTSGSITTVSPIQTWIQSVNVALASVQQPENQFDWPVPRAPQQPALSWTASYNKNLIGQDQLSVGKQVYNLPQAGPSLFQTWIQSVNLALNTIQYAFVQDDWPVPRAPQQPTSSWTASYNLNLIGQDRLPIGKQIYDLPARDFQRLFQTWINNVNLALTVSQIPENQFDWPLPRPQPPTALTWTASYNLNLIGQDRLPTGKPSYELSPRDIQRTLQTWVQSVSLALSAPTLPLTAFNQYDWPLPTSPRLTLVDPNQQDLSIRLPPPAGVTLIQRTLVGVGL